MIRRILASAVLLSAIAVPTGAHADPPSSCFDRTHPTFAKFITPSGGSAQVNTTPTGAITVQTGGAVPAVFLSTTGSIQVQIDQACVMNLVLTVTKAGQTTPVHTRVWDLPCSHDTLTENVPIGLDGGDYKFELSGTTCTGQKGRTDQNGGFVGDPPIL